MIKKVHYKSGALPSGENFGIASLSNHYKIFKQMRKVLIAGGSGLVGSRLSQLLFEKGYDIAWLSRNTQKNVPYEVYHWDVVRKEIDSAAFNKVDVIINLAGAGIADKSWTKERKQLIIDSRVNSTQLLADTIQMLEEKPKAYLASAAIGYYGDRGNDLVKEDDSPGKEGFLAESTVLWEKAIDEVRATEIRTVTFRIGIVMSTHGGALPKMAMPANFFVGTYFGDGQQWYSWIHIDDLCRMFIWAIENEQIAGIYNAVAPNPQTNKSFTTIIGKAKGRPTLNLPAPSFALRTVLGEMADTILGSTKVSAQKIIKAGFEFKFPDLEMALKDLFDRRI